MAPMTSTIDRINQLLAKAENTPYPEEAATFQEHAERLMVRHGIEMAQLDAAKDKGKREPVIFKTIWFEGQYMIAFQQGFARVVQSYGTCTVLFGGYGRQKTLYVVGAESDVAQMIAMLQSLESQAQVAVKVWWKANREAHWYLNKMEVWHTKREFVLNFGKGAAQRVREMVRVEEKADAGTALVLRNRQEVAVAAIPSLFGKTGTYRGGIGRRGTGDAAAAGQKAGREASFSTGKTIGGK